MADEESLEPIEEQHNYLDVGSTGPRKWVLVVGALFVILALAAAFYGLYAINQSASPASIPESALLTQAPVGVAVTQGPGAVPTATVLALAPTMTLAVTATTEASTYTVQQGDTLIAIAHRLNVSVDDLTALNRLRDETIYPNRVLLVPPTVTPWPETGPLRHTISRGESLISIATLYNVTVEEIKTLNNLTSDTILGGQQILIPAKGIRPLPVETVEPTVPFSQTTITDESWQPSLLEGDLKAGYPLTLESERFTLHYQPDTPAAQAPNLVAAQVELALGHIEEKLHVTLKDRFDIYVAGSLFASDGVALGGRSFSSQRRSFYLYDGTGTPDESFYTITNELTHLVARYTIGQPSSALLHEGLAVYTGVEALEAAGFIPLPRFCAAYKDAGQLPSLSGNHAYLDHIRDMDLYYIAGCFVQYLIEEYGTDSFKQLFASGKYWEIYGRTLAQLEADWIESLEPASDELAFIPDNLVASVSEVVDAYDRLFTDFSGTQPQMAAYRQLDQARIAVLQGRFEETQDHLGAFEELLLGE